MSKEGECIFTFGDKGPEKGGNHCMKAFDHLGTFLYKFGKEDYQDGEFKTLYGLFVDSSNNLLVCDSGNNRVQQLSLDDRFISKSITRLNEPSVIKRAPDGRILASSSLEKKVYILK